MKKWEYMVVDPRTLPYSMDFEYVVELNKRGFEGWELCLTNSSGFFVFKRETI